jgi:hypothetical protein
MLETARHNARMTRTALTREVWEATNIFWMRMKEALARPVRETDLPGHDRDDPPAIGAGARCAARIDAADRRL